MTYYALYMCVLKKTTSCTHQDNMCVCFSICICIRTYIYSIRFCCTQLELCSKRAFISKNASNFSYFFPKANPIFQNLRITITLFCYQYFLCCMLHIIMHNSSADTDYFFKVFEGFIDNS